MNARYRVRMDAVSPSSLKSFMTSLLMRPLLQPLEAAFGDYAGIAEQEFARALARVPERSHE